MGTFLKLTDLLGKTISVELHEVIYKWIEGGGGKFNC